MDIMSGRPSTDTKSSDLNPPARLMLCLSFSVCEKDMTYFCLDFSNSHLDDDNGFLLGLPVALGPGSHVIFPISLPFTWGPDPHFLPGMWSFKDTMAA